jgi:hypothetical protein
MGVVAHMNTVYPSQKPSGYGKGEKYHEKKSKGNYWLVAGEFDEPAHGDDGACGDSMLLNGTILRITSGSQA